MNWLPVNRDFNPTGKYLYLMDKFDMYLKKKYPHLDYTIEAMNDYSLDFTLNGLCLTLYSDSLRVEDGLVIKFNKNEQELNELTTAYQRLYDKIQAAQKECQTALAAYALDTWGVQDIANECFHFAAEFFSDEFGVLAMYAPNKSGKIKYHCPLSPALLRTLKEMATALRPMTTKEKKYERKNHYGN